VRDLPFLSSSKLESLFFLRLAIYVISVEWARGVFGVVFFFFCEVGVGGVVLVGGGFGVAFFLLLGFGRISDLWSGHRNVSE